MDCFSWQSRYSLGNIHQKKIYSFDGQRSIAFSADGKKVIFATGAKIKLYPLKVAPANKSKILGHEIHTYKQKNIGRTLFCRFAANDQVAVVGIKLLQFWYIVLWDVVTGRELHKFSKRVGELLAFSHNGRLALVQGANKKEMQLWDTFKEKQIASFDFYRKSKVSFSLDDTKIIIGRDKNFIQVWDIKGKKLAQKEEINAIAALAISNTSLTFMAETPPKKEYSLPKLWDFKRNKVIELPEHGWFESIVATFSSDGKWIAVANNHEIRIWDTKTTKLWSLFKTSHSKITSLHFTKNGHFLASAQNDGTLTIWNVPKKRKMQSFADHTYYAFDVAFAKNSFKIISGSENGITLIHDFSRIKRYLQFEKEVHDLVNKEIPWGRIGEWYYFFGEYAKALNYLKHSQNVSHLILARCYWQTGNSLAAHREFSLALKNQEANFLYIKLCLAAIKAEK